MQFSIRYLIIWCGISPCKNHKFNLPYFHLLYWYNYEQTENWSDLQKNWTRFLYTFNKEKVYISGIASQLLAKKTQKPLNTRNAIYFTFYYILFIFEMRNVVLQSHSTKKDVVLYCIAFFKNDIILLELFLIKTIGMTVCRTLFNANSMSLNL